MQGFYDRLASYFPSVRTDLKAPSMLHGILFVMKSAVSIIDLDWVIVNTILGDRHCRVQ
jgi:hypothetical protein